jgi:hypothetical protein
MAASLRALAQDNSTPTASTPSAGISAPSAATTPPAVGQQPAAFLPSTAGPGLVNPNTPTMPTPIATGGGLDTSNSTKFYTITASLREEYDDNIYTVKDNPTASAVTEISPSFLINLPLRDSTFVARYTFGFDYYENRSGDPNDYTHELLVNYTHQFTDRFSLSLGEQFGYFTQPDLLAAVGTPFVSGSYFANTFSGSFNAQWTPIFGTATTYSNILIDYQSAQVGTEQNSDENTITQDFRFALIPKFNFVASGTYDNLDYFSNIRGYTDYTGDVGVDWQALPNLSLSVRGGITVTVSDPEPTSISPYASVNLDWHLGKRSELSFNYTHNVVPTDVFNAIGQEADRFSVRFSYDLTARINVHAEGIETHADYTSELLEDNVPSFTEDDIGLDLGVTYHMTPIFSLEGGYFLSDISSQESDRDYTRNQVYVGIRGTY